VAERERGVVGLHHADAGVTRSGPASALTLALLTVFGACAARPAQSPPPRPKLRVITGTPGGGVLPLAESLAAVYRQQLPEVDVDIVPSPGAVANAEAIQHGDADIGFVFADVTYTAFVGRFGNAAPFDRLRAILVLQIPAVHLVVRPNLAINNLGGLRGRRVGVGPPGSGTALTAELVLGAAGLSGDAIRAEGVSFDEGARRMLSGTLDAMFDDAIYPAEAIQRVTAAGGRLVPIEGASIERLQQQYPFFRATTIPPHAYPRMADATPTIGVDSVLLCRRDLDDELVYNLTRRFFDALPTLSASMPALRLMDLDQAPAAPIPLHEGAARYYRERELMR
jgi:TRAP transporter TAXI family solute receptor